MWIKIASKKRKQLSPEGSKSVKSVVSVCDIMKDQGKAKGLVVATIPYEISTEPTLNTKH